MLVIMGKLTAQMILISDCMALNKKVDNQRQFMDVLKKWHIHLPIIVISHTMAHVCMITREAWL